MDQPHVTLRSMTDDELDAYLRWAEANLTVEMARARGATTDATAPAARRQLDAVLPGGRPRPDRTFALTVVDGGRGVGSILCGRQDDLGQGRIYLYDIVIDEAERGRGLGRAAMIALEGLAASLGAGAIALNVFGHNRPARALYESLGYEIQHLGMAKPLG